MHLLLTLNNLYAQQMQASHDAEKKNFLLMLDKYKQDVRYVQEDIVSKYEAQIMFLTRYYRYIKQRAVLIITRDLEDIKGQFTDKVKQFSSISQQLQAKHSEELEQLKLAHSLEVIKQVI